MKWKKKRGIPAMPVEKPPKHPARPDVPVMVTISHASFRPHQEIQLFPEDGDKTIKEFLLDLLERGRREDGYLYYTDEPSAVNSLLINACLKAREWKYFSERKGCNVKMKKRLTMKRIVSGAINFKNRSCPLANLLLVFYDGDPLEIPDDCKVNRSLKDALEDFSDRRDPLF